MKNLLFYFLLFFTLPSFLLGQTEVTTTTTSPPTVNFSQGKLLANLPYGRSFFINGPNKIPDGTTADSIGLSIWETDIRRIRRNQQIAYPKDPKKYTGKTPIYTATWLKGLATDTSNFSLYVDRPLDFSRLYIVKLSFAKKFTLSTAQRDQIIQDIKDQTESLYQSNGGVGKSQVEKIIGQEIRKALGAYTGNYEEQLDVKVPLVSDQLLSSISVTYSQLARQEEQLKSEQSNLREATSTNDTASMTDFNKSIGQINTKITNLQDDIDNTFLQVRSTFADAYSTYIIASSSPNSLSEINNINIGTAFGASVVGLNFQEEATRAYDVFGYAALKFYLMPVDKRIADPYLSDIFFINRLAVLVGVSLSGDLNYRGSDLDKVLSVYPVLGLSYDVNRYLTVDLGVTAFEQDSISPLTNTTNFAIAPL
ncbi:MAG: hypothetical protein AAFP19_24540, partial [Bacteroidota bacterium]